MEKQFAVVLIILILVMTGSTYGTMEASKEPEIVRSSLPCPCAKIPYHTEAYLVDFGMHDGQPGKDWVTVEEVIRIPGVPWLRLHFSEYNLGTRSYIRITSLQDGARQHIDSSTMRYCHNSSAYFNGDVVTVELIIASVDQDVFLKITEITAGDWVGETKGDRSRSLCDDDDRVSSIDHREGRLMPVGCTGWIVSNGAHLTAGHCVDPDMQILEFNVPDSHPNGTVQHPGLEDQYNVLFGSIVSHDDGPGVEGNDWAVFNVAPNTETGLHPVHAQGPGAFFRISRDHTPSTARVTGYGADETPPGTTGGRNEDSQTLQTDAGDYLGEFIESDTDITIEYIVDTSFASSGSPVIVDGLATTIGIHTNAGCDPPHDGNKGTGFENDDLEEAIHTFWGDNFIYVDQDHPVAHEDGTICRPYDTVLEAVNTVVSGGNISIVRESYDEQITIDKALTLFAPVGSVVIG